MSVRMKPDDVKWAKAIKAADQYTCRRCHTVYAAGHRGIHAHHIFTRSRKTTRHDLLNGLTLCMGCHLWAHKNPLEFAEWAREQLTAPVFDALRARSRSMTKAWLEAAEHEEEIASERSAGLG